MASNEIEQLKSNKKRSAESESYEMEEYSYENHEDKVVDDLAQLLNKPEYSDIMFVVESKEIFCHKAVLSSRCEYFRTMFRSELTNKEKIEITTMTYDDFLAIASFVYTGKIELVFENAQMLLQHADMMQYKDLKEVIQQFFTDKLRPDNVLGIHAMAVQLHAKSLEKVAWYFALDNFQDIKKEEEFVNYSADEMGNYLGNANLNTPTEDTVCSALIKWFQQSPEERGPSMKSLLFQLRLDQLSLEFVHFDLLNNPKIPLSPEICEILQGLALNIVLLTPIPAEIPIQFPRRKSDLAHGIAIISANRCTGIQINLCDVVQSHSVGDEVVGEVNSIMCNAPFGKKKSTQIKYVCFFDKFLYFFGTQKKNGFDKWEQLFYRMELSNNQWVALKPIRGSDTIPIASYKRKLLGVTYKTYNNGIRIRSIRYYCQDHSSWINIINLDIVKAYSKQNKFAVILCRNFLFILGIEPNVPDDESRFTAILGVDLESKTTAVLATQLRNNIHILRALVYRGHVIIVTEQSNAVGKVFFQSMPVKNLEKDINDKKNGIESEGMDLSACVARGIDSSMHKLGDTLQVELVGNQLLVMRQSKNSPMKIYAIDADDVMNVKSEVRSETIHSTDDYDTFKALTAVKFSRLQHSL